MPFQNMTKDTIWDIWQDGIQEKMISILSNNKELKIRQKGTTDPIVRAGKETSKAVISPDIAGNISRKLDASLFIYGSIKKAGPVLSVDAQLIDARTKVVIQTFETKGFFREENVFQIIDTLTSKLTNFLLISKLIKEDSYYQLHGPPYTRSAEAFRYNTYGDLAAAKLNNTVAISFYLKALAADSNFLSPMMGLSSVYAREENMEQDFYWVLKYYKKKDQWPVVEQLWASWAYALSFEPPEKSIEYLHEIHRIDDKSSASYLLGVSYNRMNLYDLAIRELEKNKEMCRKWGEDFMHNNSAWTELGFAYHKTGQYKKEKKLYRMAEKYLPDDGPLTAREVILAWTENDTAAARRYLEKFIYLHKKRYLSGEGHLNRRLAEIYDEAGKPDEAENFFRKSLGLEPDNPVRMYILARFLIDRNRKPDEVTTLLDAAMAKARDRYDFYNYLDTKGWGLYKQGKYREALAILQKTYDEAPYKIYTLKYHLEETRKAVAGLR